MFADVGDKGGALSAKVGTGFAIRTRTGFKNRAFSVASRIPHCRENTLTATGDIAFALTEGFGTKGFGTT
jgi:hypothetical protein